MNSSSAHRANTPTFSDGDALASVRAPRSAPCRMQAPRNSGSPRRAAALSTEQQSTQRTPCERMWRSAPELRSAIYIPPLPSGAVAICREQIAYGGHCIPCCQQHCSIQILPALLCSTHRCGITCPPVNIIIHTSYASWTLLPHSRPLTWYPSVQFYDSATQGTAEYGGPCAEHVRCNVRSSCRGACKKKRTVPSDCTMARPSSVRHGKLAC